jgi:hypothetical protein
MDSAHELRVFDPGVCSWIARLEVGGITLAIATATSRFGPVRRAKEISCDGADIDVRALGIDAPERATDPHERQLREIFRRVD